MVSVCTFDNPNAWRRECWQDGRMVFAISKTAFFLKRWPIPPRYFFFGANIGPWKDGQVVGDPNAIGDDDG